MDEFYSIFNLDKTLMKHKGLMEKFIKEKAKENGHTFLKINWNKRQLHYLSKGGNKVVESLIIPRIVEK